MAAGEIAVFGWIKKGAPRFGAEGREMWFRTRNEERRAALRVAATGRVLVTWHTDGQPRQKLGRCADLSAEGASIVELQDSVPAGTGVHIRFMAINLETDGVVCRSEAPGSIGVRFTSLTMFASPGKRQHVPAYVRFGRILGGASLLVVIGISTWSYANSGRVWPINVRLHPSSSTVVASPSFSLAASKAEAQAARGYTAVAVGNSRVYGPSSVYSLGARVLGWQGMPSFPVQVRNETAKTGARGRDYFAVGATASEVAAVQGVPAEVRGNVWAYGPSEVYFRADRVVGWKNAAQRPLKVHGAPIAP